MLLLRDIQFTSKKVESFPFNIPAFSKDFILPLSQPVTFFVGENGAGKSTFLESIAYECGFSLLGGSRNNLLHEPAHTTKLPLKLSWNQKTASGFFMRAESFFNFASYLEQLQKENPSDDIYASYGGKSLHRQSHGEAFLSLFSNRFRKGIFILDEPEAALSPNRQLSFLALLHDLSKSGEAQFLIATHSPILLTYPQAEIFSFDNDLEKVSYEETEHFTLTKDFLNSPESFFRHLF